MKTENRQQAERGTIYLFLWLIAVTYFQLAVFMYKFHNNLLPSVFDPYFNSVRILHNYNARLSSKMTCYSTSQNKLWNFQHKISGC